MLGNDRHLSFWDDRVALILRPKPSAVNTERKGERGSPCLIPRYGWKGEEEIPLIKIEKKEEEMRLMTQRVQVMEKPKASRVF